MTRAAPDVGGRHRTAGQGKDMLEHPILTRHRPRLVEFLPLLLCLAVYVVAPSRLELGTQIVIMAIFTLSLDMILGQAGIATLGHAAFFGIGAYAAGFLPALFGWGEPLSGLAAAAIAAGAAGIVIGWVILRTSGLTLLMLTMVITFLLHELAIRWRGLTGGSDGLQGVSISPLLGMFPFDLANHVGFAYALAVATVLFVLARAITHLPFGLALRGIRDNRTRMHALGAPVQGHLIVTFGLSAAVAGVAGALSCQVTEFVAPDVFSFERSGAVLVMLILGGIGRLYGAFWGAAVYMIVQDVTSKFSPELWYFWVGALLVATVMFARGGMLGLVDVLLARLKKAPQ